MVHVHSSRTVSLAFLPLTLFSLAVLGTTGCNRTQDSAASSPDTTTARSIQGRVYGGQQPVVGATIQLYTVGTGGYGAGAVSVIAGTPTTTGSNGAFTFTYNIPSTPSYFYIVATGGSPGSGNPANEDIVMMAAIGGCTATTTLDPSLFININEVTTAAAVLALQPFIAAPTGTAGAPVIGAPATAYNDLRTAFETASALVNISTGTVVNPTGSKGQLINTLADILASCVNSDPSSSNNCSNLFQQATPSGNTTVAADTTQAAWYIAQNPTTNTSTLFNLISGTNPPFVALPSPPASFAVTAPTDSLACFAILGGSTIVNTGPTIVSGGDVGSSPGVAVTGFPPGIVVSPATVHQDDLVAENAQLDLSNAYNYATGLLRTDNLTGQDLGGLTLTPGVHDFLSAAQLTGILTLDAQNDPDAVFIFRIGSTLTTASNAQVVLINGAQAQNVFWQVGSSATIGTGASFEGTIMAQVSITLNTGAIVQGRVLASAGAVTLDDNAVTAP